MELQQAGISEQPFRSRGEPLTFVPYLGQLAAANFLASIHTCPCGLGLLQGPPLSGKSTIIHEFVSSLHDDSAVAVIDAVGLGANSMLGAIIREFGFNLKLDSINEQVNLLRVFAMQQANLHDAPLLIIENAHALNAEAMTRLCDLAAIQVDSDCALRIVLSSDRSIEDVIQAPDNSVLALRLTGTFNLVPMEEEETSRYLYSKLSAGGCETPTALLPESVCADVHKASGGWPGVAERLMALALAKATSPPLSLDEIELPLIPKVTGKPGLQLTGQESIELIGANLYLSRNGQTLSNFSLNQERTIIGRSDHNDIAIPSRFVSKHHALFIRDGNTTLLMDLNSSNGTFVNSRRISNHIMVHEDVVTIGHHALKFRDPSAVDMSPLHDADLDQTVIMKSVDDMRWRTARENTRVVKIVGE